MNETVKSPVNQDVYTIVTNRIIELLEAGTVPWRQPWTDAGLPRNLISMRPYRGLNVWLLSTLKYDRNYFLTWKQLKDVGGEVKQGERAHIVVFWKWIKAQDKESGNDSQPKEKVFLRYYMVYNLAQCNGIPDAKIPVNARTKFNPIKQCESIIRICLIHQKFIMKLLRPSITSQKISLTCRSESCLLIAKAIMAPSSMN